MEGDIIQILELDVDGWTKCMSKNNSIGVVPTKYLEMIEKKGKPPKIDKKVRGKIIIQHGLHGIFQVKFRAWR